MLKQHELFNKLSEKRKRDAEVLLDWEYRGIWETAIKKYSGTAHFVYELLQNADDTKATLVDFRLEEDGLWFKHNGSVKFSVSDIDTAKEDTESGNLGHINSITAIGNSSKVDEQKIGKFGIGFKAVFAYSKTPHIYDDNFNFKLENYIVPNEIEPLNGLRNPGETVFFFPFDHTTKEPKQAYKEIEGKLNNLFQPILFLSNLQEIKWKSLKNHGNYKKEIIETKQFGDIKAELVAASEILNAVESKEYIWLFSKIIENNNIKSIHPIYVGFFINYNFKLETGFEYKAFCFFPTKEETNLSFIIQAPFLLTDNREGINEGEEWNIELIKSLAKLAAESLVCLKVLGEEKQTYLIDDSILDIIPYNENTFTVSSNKDRISFLPFYEEIKSILQEEKLLPGRDGKYYESYNSYWAADPELADLFSDEQISQIMNNPNSGFVFISKGQKQVNQTNKPLEAYIHSIVNESLDAKKILRRIDEEFIESQSDEWLLKFYDYLGGRKFLWDDKDKLAIRRPILLNQNRKAVIPYNEDQTAPNIFLPTDTSTSFDTIYKPFVEHEQALEFFKALGIGKPDIRAEIFNNILPNYEEELKTEDNEYLLNDFNTLLSYYIECPVSQVNEFLEKVNNKSIIAAKNNIEPKTIYFCLPNQVYIPNETLNTYFANKEDVYFLDEDFYSEIINSSKKHHFYDFLEDLGCKNEPRLLDILLPNDFEHKERFGLNTIQISNTYWYRQELKDKILDGLEEAILNIDKELSEILWNYLMDIVENQSSVFISMTFSGTFRYVPKYSQKASIRRISSTLTSILKNEKWLYDKDDNLKSPTEIYIEDLNEIYTNYSGDYSEFIEFLGIKSNMEGLNLSDEQKETYLLGKKLQEEGLTEEEIEELIKIVKSRKPLFDEEVVEDEKEEDDFIDKEISNTIEQLKKGISKKRKEKEKNIAQNIEQKEINFEEPVQDQDEYIKPSVDLQDKIDKLKEQTQAQIEDLTRIETLNEIVSNSEIYSYAWFKALIELEYLSSSEANSQGKQFSIQFTKVEKETDTERTLILKHPNRYIPQSIEDIGDLQLRLYHGETTTTLTVEVVSVREYTLRAKLKTSADISDIELHTVNRIVIDIKNPIFIIEELRKAFNQLYLEDDFNLQQNLSEDIKFIFGPPGTGKTTYLATDEIIPLMKKEEDIKVLVLTPTNKSADVLTKRIIEKMDGDESYYDWLLRFGNTAEEELENNAIVVDKTFDIRNKPKNTTITTIARFAYDYFQPELLDDRLHLKFLQWDYIIIDEASMVNLASIAYVLYQKKDAKFIIAGDPFQIQPITQIDHWKDMNIYSMVNLNKFNNPETVPHNFEIKNLQTQYRAIPTIGNIFSNFTYDGILKHHRTSSDQKKLNIKGLDFKDINLIKFPVTKFESIYKPNTLNRSNYQVYSALFTVEFIQSISREIEQNHADKFRIGIICPYKAQATLIEKLLAQQYQNTEKVEVLIGTIHGFQGDECDIILAIFNPPNSISRSPEMFLNKQNILNVSISRAKDYLFILMPDNNTEKIENLYKIKNIENLIYKLAPNNHSVYKSESIEQILFSNPTHIYDNSFATTHQSVNVYSKPERKYEIRCEETAIDVQIKQ